MNIAKGKKKKEELQNGEMSVKRYLEMSCQEETGGAERKCLTQPVLKSRSPKKEFGSHYGCSPQFLLLLLPCHSSGPHVAITAGKDTEQNHFW